MTRRAPKARTLQAWVELKTEDPGAVSAFAVARARLAAAKRLLTLRKLRCFELRGVALAEVEATELLHRSTQFYNPHKERCIVRASPGEAAPLAPGSAAILVTERGAERRPAAERWWLHESGEIIKVREGVVWVMTFESGESALECARDLAALTDRRHGLFCNPHSQDYRVSGAEVPLPWLRDAAMEADVREVGHAGLDA